MSAAASASTVFVDADACPVKREVYKVAERYGLRVVVVANAPIHVPERAGVELVVVSGKSDAADDWIAERAGAADIVVTADIPLASRAIKGGATVLTPRGERLDDDAICDALATRDLLTSLREVGAIAGGGPPPFGDRDRSRFLSRLDETVHAVRRAMRRG